MGEEKVSRLREHKKIDLIEKLYPFERCHPDSFRQDVITRAEEKYKKRTIYCCPIDDWDEEKEKCKKAMKIHAVIREEI
jgi:hypothetical protein